MFFCFVFALRFQLGATPLVGLLVVPPFHFLVGFHLFVSPPRHDGGLREGFDVGFLCLSACVLLQFAFLRLAPSPPRWRYAGRF